MKLTDYKAELIALATIATAILGSVLLPSWRKDRIQREGHPMKAEVISVWDNPKFKDVIFLYEVGDEIYISHFLCGKSRQISEGDTLNIKYLPEHPYKSDVRRLR